MTKSKEQATNQALSALRKAREDLGEEGVTRLQELLEASKKAEAAKSQTKPPVKMPDQLLAEILIATET